MKKFFNINRFRVAAAAVSWLLTGILLALAVKEEGMTGHSMAGAIALVLGCGLILLVRLPDKLKESVPGKILISVWNLILTVVIPLTAVLAVQYYFIDPWGEKPMYTMMYWTNVVFYVLVYLFISFLSGSFRWGYTIASIIFMLIGITNYFVMLFRGTPIVPWDLLSWRTAANVAGQYSYRISWRFFWSTAWFVFMMTAGFHNSMRIRKVWIRIAAAVLTAVLFFGCLSQLQKDEVKEYLGMDTTLFTPTVRYRNNGLLAAFLGNIHLIEVEEPDGYSVSRVEEIQEEIRSDAEADNKSATFDIEKAPNIIVVMDEAFSDLKVRGDFNISQDYMPYFRSVMEEHNGGHLLVSVKGGDTANTEYEFLAGDTMAFLPAGSVVFQQFVHDAVPVLPTYLKSLGYSTTAIHPYLSSGWDRERVYPLFDFEEFLDIDDFKNPVYIRNYCSDESAFDKIIEKYEENAASGKPQFIFEVTMQNHSPYSKTNVPVTVDLTDISYESTQQRALENYLSLIKASDDSFRDLIAYFEKVDEPTIIVAFGDHEPSDYVTAVVDQLTGYNTETTDLEEYEKQYQVPYFVWSNFDMEMEERSLSSANYLAANVLDAAGIPLTDFQQYLIKLQEDVPAIAYGAYVTADGTYHHLNEETDVSDQINTYNILTYNHLTDFRHRIASVFGGEDN